MFKKIILYLNRLFTKQPHSGCTRIARYLTSHGHYSIEKKIVKHNAFMPIVNSITNVPETSVFNIDELKNDNIWQLAIANVIQESGRTLYGRADLEGKNAQEIGLSVELDDNPPRHANIRGWPEKKSEQKLLAIKLAAASTLYLVPSSLPVLP